jgi:Tfp pilus assembly protein PilV
MGSHLYTSQAGGSLIEVIICAFMLSLVLFNITALKLTQAHIELQQSQYTAAWSLMADKLAELRYLTDSDDEFTQLSENKGGLMAAGDMHYDQYRFDVSWQVNVTSTSITNSTLPILSKQVVVKIRWNDRGSTAHEIISRTTFNEGIITK